MNLIHKNLKNIEERVAAACRLSNRSLSDIKIVAVTKNIPAWAINYLLTLGYSCIGENRVQELLAKNKYLKTKPEYHFIGRLQKNKVKKIVGLVDLIQSVDKLELAEEINRVAKARGIGQQILVQVNAAKDLAKAGVELEKCEELVAKISKLRHIKVVGLMTIGKLVANPEENRQAFAALKIVYDQLAAKYRSFKWLSMGMSQDFEIAVQEGANMVRIGSAIWF